LDKQINLEIKVEVLNKKTPHDKGLPNDTNENLTSTQIFQDIS